MRAEIPIVEINSIVYYGQFTSRLDFSIPSDKMFYVINQNDGSKTAINPLTIGFWVRSQADTDIGNRLQKAFWHLQTFYMKVKEKEPF